MTTPALALSLALLLSTDAPAPAAPATASPPAAAAPSSAAASAVTVSRLSDPEKALRFEVTLPASAAEVWAALTTTEGVQTWLWRDARVQLRPGGDWLVLYPGGKTGGGSVVAFVPEQRLELHAMAPEQFPEVRSVGTTAVFELTPLSPTTTRLTLLQTGWKTGQQWDDAYDYLAKGNAQLLAQLHQRFVAGPRTWPAVGGR
jgi:uncharacterized protein YndB with AHSA1/START domain